MIAAGTDFAQQFAARGVAVIDAALPTPLWEALRAEAGAERQAKAWSLKSSGNPGEINQENLRGHLGPVARAYLSSADTAGLLLGVTGRPLEPSWSASCYTYYDIPGSYMGEHCDKFDACRIALLTYLDVRRPEGQPPGPGLQLHVFRGDNSGTELVARITARSNRVVILNGGEQAHFRPPLGQGESVVMLAGCFRVAGAA
ncbi:MAG: hypothetical protein FJW39_33175 [Acidobacteria bacterium]|nr:hypothetical protein [Acidobacteriota bacterium]